MRKLVCLTMRLCLAAFAMVPPSSPAQELPAQETGYWRALAAEGDVNALFTLGLIHLGGIDLLSGSYMIANRQDMRSRFQEAKKLMALAAEKGHVEAMLILGRLLESQDDPDFAGSAKWLRKAAEVGDPEAQYDLGWLHERGLIPGEKREAERWYRRAMRLGYEKAASQLGSMPGAPNRAAAPGKKRTVLSTQWSGKNLHVIYINGILTGVPKFNQTTALLRRIFDRDGYGEHISVEGVYNPGGNAFTDIPWATVHKLRGGGGRSDRDDEIIERLRKAVERSLRGNAETILVGHSRGNLFIHDLLTRNPLLADRVHVISLGSPTRTIPGSRVQYIVERRDPVAAIGGFAEQLLDISSEVVDLLRKNRVVPALERLRDDFKDREKPKLGGRNVKSFVNPVLYKSAEAIGGAKAGKTFLGMLRDAALAPWLGVAKLVAAFDAHDVAGAYLTDPGLDLFREAVYAIAGVVQTPKSSLPPPPPERYIEVTADDMGKGIDGFWLQYVNGRQAGIYHVTRDGSAIAMQKVVSMPGAWLPYRQIRDVSLTNDVWSFIMETNYGAVEYALVRQTPDSYAAIVNHNKNIWIRTKSPWADEPLPEDTTEVIGILDATDRMPPEAISSDPAAPEPDPLGELYDQEAGEPSASPGPDVSPDPEPDGPEKAAVPKRRAILAVDPRGLVGIWTRYVEGVKAFEYEVIYDAAAKAVQMREIAAYSEGVPALSDFSNILYAGKEWTFDCLRDGAMVRVHLARHDRDTYASDSMAEEWRRERLSAQRGQIEGERPKAKPLTKRLDIPFAAPAETRRREPPPQPVAESTEEKPLEKDAGSPRKTPEAKEPEKEATPSADGTEDEKPVDPFPRTPEAEEPEEEAALGMKEATVARTSREEPAKKRKGETETRTIIARGDEDAALRPTGRDLALCVGINGYSRMDALKYSVNDAYAVKRRLEESRAFRRVTVVSDVDENGNPQQAGFQPTEHIIMGRLEQLARAATPDDTFLFFFSGHGVERDGAGFLIPIDGDESSAIPLDRIRDVLSKSRAGNKLVIIDACRPGGAPGIRRLFEEQGIGMLASCGEDQVSHEDGRAGLSLFTLVLADALSGESDGDGDGTVTGAELFARLETGMGDYFLDNDILASQTPAINEAGKGTAVLRVGGETASGDGEGGATGASAPRADEKPSADAGEDVFTRGLALYEETGSPERQAEAARLFREAAEQGDSRARNQLGLCYAYGRGVQRDYGEALSLFAEAAEEGVADAQFNAGFMVDHALGTKENFPRAFELYSSARGQGDVRALYLLGWLYFNGQGVAKDEAKARELFAEAKAKGVADTLRVLAEKGDAWSQNLLGGLYANDVLGIVDEDVSEAAQWFRKAAEQGLAIAQNNLGILYRDGDGVGQDHSQAAEWFRKAAEQGLAAAQNDLGFCYYAGSGVSQDYSEAATWCRKAAEQGFAVAQYGLGVLYRDGKGVGQDHSQAAEWFRMAAEQGDADAQYELGVCYYGGHGVSQDHVQAAEWFRKAAEQGHAMAQLNLGRLYRDGDGVGQDHSQAAAWFRKAAEQGLAVAQSELGGCYYNGRGVIQDYSEAAAWCRKAAEQGYVFAQYVLGALYRDGDGVSQDHVQAAAWFRKAAEQGHAVAQSNLGRLYRDGEGVGQDHVQAAEWFLKAAEQGLAAAQNDLGFCYYAGSGVSRDYSEAAVWFRKAAEQGFAAAQYGLGVLYRDGNGVGQDHVQAAEWFLKAAEQELAAAQNDLGFCYYAGSGVSRDYSEAAAWFRKAAEQRNAIAQFNLGVLYRYGKGVSQDHSQAAEWFRKAAEQGHADAKQMLEELETQSPGMGDAAVTGVNATLM